MHRSDKERVVAELTERLRRADTLIVTDYRGLTNVQLENLRDELIKHGARLSIVKNTLTRRAAEAAGSDALLALLEGPSAIAFIEADGDPVSVAKALSDTARESRILEIRGGIMQGRSIDSAAVEELSAEPPEAESTAEAAPQTAEAGESGEEARSPEAEEGPAPAATSEEAPEETP